MRSVTKRIVLAVALGLTIGVAGRADAGLVGYVNNPTTNSVDFTNAVTTAGGTVDSNVNFNTHPLGTLNPTFYTASDGVTLTPSDSGINQVVFGEGPNDGNTATTPISPGEGLHAPSNYLAVTSAPHTLTLSFATPVYGAGLSTIDYFNPTGSNNFLTVSAYTGQNGTGTLLGTFTSLEFNFQPDHKYFMGITSTDNNIGSFVFTKLSSNTGDNIGLDDILIGRLAPAAAPEPATIVSASIAGLMSIGFAWRRRKAKPAA